MTRCPLCLQGSPAYPPLSHDAEAVMLAVQRHKATGTPITVPGIALACGFNVKHSKHLLDGLLATGWLGHTPWRGEYAVLRWVPQPFGSFAA